MYQKKLEYLIEVGRKFRNAKAALGITVGELRPLRSGAEGTVSLEGEVTWKGDLKSRKDEEKYTFQEAYNYLNKMDSALDAGVLLEKVDFDSLMPPPHNPRLFQPDFQFSDDQDIFAGEFRHVRWLFAYAKGEDEKIDFLAMKALFHAGRILGLLEAEGEARSNKMTEAGRSKRKGYVSHEKVVDEAKKVSKRLTSRRDIARAVRKRLVKAESDKENPKKVFKEDYIRKHILPKK